MAVFTVDSTVTAEGDGLTSLQEAFAAAVQASVSSGKEMVIRFAQAMDINLLSTLEVTAGAKIVIDGSIEGDMTFETGGNDVALHGDNGAGYSSGSTTAYGHTMFKVDAGGSLRLSDVELADNLVAGAAGSNGASGSNGLNGKDGESHGLPGSSANGGLSVATSGGKGQDAVSGVLNLGTLVLDRVNMNHLMAYAGNGGAAGSGGRGGDGGNGNAAEGGSGGPGGSGEGHGGTGGDAAAGVMNFGTMTMLDTTFQTDFVFAGTGGSGGNGGDGGKGGKGTLGGAGGNGGVAGNGGHGGDAAVTVLNHGTVNLAGGWVYNAGSNLIWSGSGAGGIAGTGGIGGAGVKGSDPLSIVINGTTAASGHVGTGGTEAAAVGWSGSHVATSYFIEANRSTLAEYAGPETSATVLTIYRMGDASAAGSVTLSAVGLGGALGGNLQDGLFSGRVITFAAGEAMQQVYIFVKSDGIAGGLDSYRFSLTAATGGVLGGNVSAEFSVSNRDIVGNAKANHLTGTGGADVLLGGLGNDTLKGLDGADRMDGQGGLDWVDYSGVTRGLKGVGLVADMAMNTATGAGVGTDQIFNIENLIGSAFRDTVLGDFNGNRIEGRGGNDRLDGNFGNDTLVGGAGRDTLIGGLGHDSFVFSSALVAGNLDRLVGFSHADDTMLLTRTGSGPFDALDFGALTANEFRAGTTATTTAQHILYDRTTGTLFYDADGSDSGFAPLAFAILNNRPVLSFDDFTVI